VYDEVVGGGVSTGKGVAGVINPDGVGEGVVVALPPELPPVPSLPPLLLPGVPLVPDENQLEPSELPEEEFSGGLTQPAIRVRITRKITQMSTTRLVVITRGW
jgi:hypothetical protein